jgi:hypothetical protein
MKLSYTAIWADTVRLIRAHGSLAAALAGVFIFLPALLIGHFLPTPQTSDPNQVVNLIVEHFRANFHWMLLSALLSSAGALAILFLVLRGATTVGAAIAAAFALLVPYFLAVVLTGIPIAVGIALFIVPGLYLIGRLVPLGPVMVAEGTRNPLAAIARTWRLTKGHGWAVTGFFLLVIVAGLILSMVLTMAISLIFRLALPDDIAGFLGLIVSTAANTALQVVMVFVYAAVYRALAGRSEALQAAPDPELGARPPATVRDDRSAD